MGRAWTTPRSNAASVTCAARISVQYPRYCSVALLRRAGESTSLRVHRFWYRAQYRHSNRPWTLPAVPVFSFLSVFSESCNQFVAVRHYLQPVDTNTGRRG
jgi:hypothetical protein